MRIGTQIGVWTRESVWQIEDIERVVRRIGKAELEGIELFAWQLSAFKAERARLRSLLSECELQLTGAYFDKGDFTRSEAHAEVLEEASWAAGFVAELGGRHLLLNGGVQRGDRAFEEEDFRRVAELFNRVGEQCARLGITAALHPHVGCQIEGIEDVERLLGAGLDRRKVSLVIHAVHQVLSGHDPYALSEKYADWISYVHVGDVSADKQGAKLGQGILDQGRLMRPLIEQGYQGWFIIESSAPELPQEAYVAHARRALGEHWRDGLRTSQGQVSTNARPL